MKSGIVVVGNSGITFTRLELRLKVLGKVGRHLQGAWDDGLKSIGSRIFVGIEGKRLTFGHDGSR